MKLAFLLLLTLSSVFASGAQSSTQRPPSFAHQGAKAVFVDFEEAVYDITYDLNLKSAEVIARFRMQVPEPGYPVFDVVEEPTVIKIDGIYAGASITNTPSQETKLRVINRILRIGTYQLEVRCPLRNLTEFSADGVKSAFWVSDLEDRTYLERYLPVNLEYDKMKITFNIKFKGSTNKQHVFANGLVTWPTDEDVKIVYPAYFSMNSLYFHTTPVGSVELLESSFKSRNGKDVPVQVYAAKSPTALQTIEDLKEQAQNVLNELERDFGPFPHASLTIYNANLTSMGLGGMEYAGATVTDRGSLSHELFHSYFGRGFVPANGNAGWIDEALASWRDYNYYRMVSLNGSSAMAAHPIYTRKTDTAAYGFGPRFMAFLDHKLSSKGGLKPFMAKLLEKKLFEPMTTEDFIRELETYFKETLQPTFTTYVYGLSNEGARVDNSRIHRKLNPRQLQSIL